MEADGIGPGVRVAALVGEHVVEVGDLAQAVAAEREGVGHATESPLARVEGALPRVHRSGIAVGDDHLADRGPEQQRADPASVLVADGMDDQAFEGVHAHPERPLLPAHQVAVDRETRALLLGDGQRAQIGAQRSVVLGVVASALGRERHHADVDDLEHRAPSHVDVGHEPLERAGVPVVVGRVAEVRQRLGDPPVLLVVRAERPAGHGSICTSDLSTMPRRSRAAFQSGSSRRAPMTPIASSICRLGRTSVTSTQLSTAPRVTDTVASTTVASGPWRSTARTRRSSTTASPLSCACTSALGGSHRPT